MARLFVCTYREPHADRRLDFLTHDRGDVVEVLPTGTFGGTKVHGNPRFRIIDVDGDVFAYTFLLERERPEPGKSRHLRKWKIDLDAIEAAEAKRLGRALAADDIIETTMDKVVTTAVPKIQLVDPRILE